MAFSHLINCVLLAYGPYFVVYKAKNLANYRVIYGLLISSLGYLLTQSFKMILLSVIIPASTDINETTEYNLLDSIKKNLFNVIDFIGIYMMLKYRWSQIDELLIRSIVLGLGWSLADSVCSNLFTLIMNASGDELNWNYMLTALLSNFEFLEIVCCIALAIQIQKILRNGNIQKLLAEFLIIFFLIAKFCLLPTILQKEISENEGITITSVGIKAAFSLTLLAFSYFKQYFTEK